MSKPLRHTAALPGPVAAAFALRTSASWVEHKAARLEDGSAVRERTTDGDRVDLVLQRDIPTDVPGMFRRFIPADGKVTQHESWSPDGDGYRVSWSLGFDGAPGSVSGEGSLVPDGEGSTLQLDGVARVSVPVIGGKAEGFLVPLVESIMAREGALLATILTAVRS